MKTFGFTPLLLERPASSIMLPAFEIHFAIFELQ
jgi:hypothetical protein